MLGSPRRVRDVRSTLDEIAEEILARLEDVMARAEPGAATVIISGDTPVAASRDRDGWRTRIEAVDRVLGRRRG